MSRVGWEGVYMLSSPSTEMCWVFWGSHSRAVGKLDRRVRAPVLSFGENLFFIHFCSLVPSSSFCKDWVFPKCFRQAGRAATQAAKIEQAPQLFWGLAVVQPFTLRGPGSCDVQAWYYPHQQK